jgi:hypothetical protein
MVGLIGCAAISGLAHGVADTQWPNGQRLTIGVSGKLLAPSSSGKSMLRKFFFDFAQHYSAENCAGELATFFMSDVDRKAFFEALHILPISTLVTDEYDQLQDLLRHPGSLAKLISGETIDHARTSTGRMQIPFPAVVLLASGQPDIFETHRHQWIGGVGLGNRFLWAFSDGPEPGASMHDIWIPPTVEERFHQKVKESIDHTVHALRAGKRPIILLTDKAAKYLTDLSRKTQDGCKSTLLQYIGRHSERVLRLAGAFTAFEEGPEADISCEMIERAEACDEYSMWAFAQIVNVRPKPTQIEADADTLERALILGYRNTSIWKFREPELRTYAVNYGLTTGRFNKALAHLAVADVVTVVNRNKVTWIEVNLKNRKLRFDY